MNMWNVCAFQLNDGIWEGTVNIADCVKSQEDPLPKIQLIADVNQRETYRPVSAIVEYDAYGSGFELIPLRPAYTEHTPKIFIYVSFMWNSLSFSYGFFSFSDLQLYKLIPCFYWETSVLVSVNQQIGIYEEPS